MLAVTECLHPLPTLCVMTSSDLFFLLKSKLRGFKYIIIIIIIVIIYCNWVFTRWQ